MLEWFAALSSLAVRKDRAIAAWGVLVALRGALALGQTTVGDDFESGVLSNSDGGSWSTVQSRAGNSIGISPIAAHRGDGGLRIIDGTANGSAGMEAEVTFHLSLPVSAGAYYLRYWARMTASGSTDTLVLGEITTDLASPASPAISELRARLPSGNIWQGGADHVAYYTDTDTVSLTDGGWHLLEEGALAIGTDAGHRILWVDGVAYPSPTRFDWTGVSVIKVAAGEDWADFRAYTGVIDLDDVRSSLVAPASTLVVIADAGTAVQGTCFPLRVELRSSQGSAASAPYAVDAQLHLTGVSGGFFFDSACALPTLDVLLADGGESVNVWFKPDSAGIAQLDATQTDFLSASAGLSVSSSSGTDGGSIDGGNTDGGNTDGGSIDGGLGISRSVGCGCTSTSQLAGALAWLCALVLHRRAARRCP
jgi:hypothetical protein